MSATKTLCKHYDLDENNKPLNAKDVIKFAFLVGFSAIFIDAVIAHGLFWENDPYWTYWVTKTFLITTVFALGTSYFGIGLYQGLGITVIHTMILEIYYQWFSPIGLPQEPEWLDENKLWITGIPVHYLAILCGYFIALWIWRRNHLREISTKSSYYNSHFIAFIALVTALLATGIDAFITHQLLRNSFPGLTHIIQNTLVSFVFLFAWYVYIGLDRVGLLVGAGMLSLLWTAYSMYLGPLGYPTDQQLGSGSFSAEGISTLVPQYLGFNALWFKALPGGFIAALFAMIIARYSLCYLQKYFSSYSSRTLIILLCFITSLQAVVAPGTKEGYEASASASGKGIMVVGPDPVNIKSTMPITGSISLSVVEMGTRWSHIQNTDKINLVAEFRTENSSYKITVNKVMPKHPLGRYTTWNGVILRHPMHGHTGIGTSKLPRVVPDIAIWGWAEVIKDGKVLSKMAPAHAMVIRQKPKNEELDMRGIMLEISSEDKDLVGEPNGFITVMWHTLDSFSFPEQELFMRQVIGWIVLIGMTLFFGILATRRKTVLCHCSVEDV